MGRLGAAVGRPGIDPRVWASMAVVTAFHADAGGVYVDVMLLPDEEPETARVGSIYAGPGYGIYAPIEVDSEVLVIAPHGDPDEGLVVAYVLWSPSDAPPAEATESTEASESTVIVRAKDGARLRIITVGANVDIEARGDGAQVNVTAGGNVNVEAGVDVTAHAARDVLASADRDVTATAGRDALVQAQNDATVSAQNNALVSAGVDATVTAAQDAAVSAGVNATVGAGADATVTAGADALVDAQGNATVQAGADATVQAVGVATVTAPRVVVDSPSVELGAATAVPADGVVQGLAVEPFTGMTAFALGWCSTKVKAVKA